MGCWWEASALRHLDLSTRLLERPHNMATKVSGPGERGGSHSVLCGPAPYSHTIISTVSSWLGGKHHWGHPAGDLLQLGTVLTMLPQPHLIWPHPLPVPLLPPPSPTSFGCGFRCSSVLIFYICCSLCLEGSSQDRSLTFYFLQVSSQILPDQSLPSCPV